MKPKIISTILIIALASALAPFFSPPAQAAGQQSITVNYYYWDPWRGGVSADPVPLVFSANEQPQIVNGRVLVPLRNLAEYFGYQVDYLPDSGKIMLSDSYGKTMELTIGQRQALVNGRQVLLDVPADAKNGVTFVPLRFIAESFDLFVNWVDSTRTVSIFNYVISTPGYIFYRTDCSLYKRGVDGRPSQLIADLSEKEPRWDYMWIFENTTALGNDVVMIGNNYGEPHLWTDYYCFYIADSKLVGRSVIRGLLHPSRPAAISADGTRVILADGKTAVAYDDRTQQIVASYDLAALCGGAFADVPLDADMWDEHTGFNIVGYGENYLLLVGGFSRLHLVVYPESGQVDVVYKEILPTGEQARFERAYVDGPMGADVVNLSFMGEKDGFLIFTCNLDRVEGHDVEYRLKLREAISY